MAAPGGPEGADLVTKVLAIVGGASGAGAAVWKLIDWMASRRDKRDDRMIAAEERFERQKEEFWKEVQADRARLEARIREGEAQHRADREEVHALRNDVMRGYRREQRLSRRIADLEEDVARCRAYMRHLQGFFLERGINGPVPPTLTTSPDDGDPSGEDEAEADAAPRRGGSS